MFLHIILIHIMNYDWLLVKNLWWKGMRAEEKSLLKYQIEMLHYVVPVCPIRSWDEIYVFFIEVWLFWSQRVGKHSLGVSSVLKANEYSL